MAPTQETPSKAPTAPAPASKPKTPAQTAKPFDLAKHEAAQQKAKEAKEAKTASAAPSINGEPVPDFGKAMDMVQTKIKAMNANNVARVANSHITSPSAKLHPLVSLKNGKPLDKFPEFSPEIEKLSLANVDAILNALEADRSGNEGAKKERLRVQLGLVGSPA